MEGEEENFQNASEVASGTFWGLVGSCALKLISFLYIIYIARVVSQNDIGLFYLALSIIGLISAGKSLGLPAALTRYIPFYEGKGEHGKARGLFKCTLAANAAVGVLLTAALWLGADAAGTFYQNAMLPDALRFLALFMLLDNLLSTATSFLQARSDIKGLQVVTNMQTLFKFLLTVLFFGIYGPNLAALSGAYILSFVLAIALSAVFVKRKFDDLPSGEGGLSWGELVHEIAPFGMMLTVVSVLWTIVSYSDRVILGFFVPPEQATALVAIYSMAVTLALNVMVFPATVGGIFMPTISRLVGRNDHEGIRKSMATAQRWVLFISLPFTIVMVAFAPEMLLVFYGGEYGSGGAVMAIFCVGLVFSVFSYIFALTLAGMRQVVLEFKIAIVVVAVNVALCFLLIPMWGIEGAAISAAAAFFVSAALFSHYACKIIRFRAQPETYKIIGAAVLVFLLLVAIKPVISSAAGTIPQMGGPELRPYAAKIAYLLLLGAVSLLSFAAVGVLSLLAKCFGREDIAVMKQAAARARMPKRVLAIAERIISYGIQEKK